MSLAGGVVCYYAVGIVKRGLSIDDSLDVFAVYAVGGILGVLLTAVFASPGLSGLGFADGVESIGDQFWRQLVGAAVTFVWAGIATVVNRHRAGGCRLARPRG